MVRRHHHPVNPQIAEPVAVEFEREAGEVRAGALELQGAALVSWIWFNKLLCGLSFRQNRRLWFVQTAQICSSRRIPAMKPEGLFGWQDCLVSIRTAVSVLAHENPAGRTAPALTWIATGLPKATTATKIPGQVEIYEVLLHLIPRIRPAWNANVSIEGHTVPSPGPSSQRVGTTVPPFLDCNG